MPRLQALKDRRQHFVTFRKRKKMQPKTLRSEGQHNKRQTSLWKSQREHKSVNAKGTVNNSLLACPIQTLPLPIACDRKRLTQRPISLSTGTEFPKSVALAHQPHLQQTRMHPLLPQIPDLLVRLAQRLRDLSEFCGRSVCDCGLEDGCHLLAL